MTSSRAFGKSGSQVCSTVAGPRAGSCSPGATSTGTSLPRTSSAKSAPAQASSTRANASTSECSSDQSTTRLTKIGELRLPVVKSMMPKRLSRLSAAPQKSARPSSSNGVGIELTGLMPTSASTRSGARASTCCTTAPPIEWPTREKVCAPTSSATASMSGAVSVQGLVARLTSTVTEATHVREDPGEPLGVEVVDEGPPPLRRPEPSVGQQDVARAGTDDVVRDRHDSPSSDVTGVSVCRRA